MSSRSTSPGEEDGKSAKDNISVSSKQTKQPRLGDNRLHSYNLESNPFEASFGQPNTHPVVNNLGPPSPRLRPSSKDGNGGDRPKLPPIAAMQSPASNTYGGWSSDFNSLRAGPLSPAMLPGPAGYSHAGLQGHGGMGGYDMSTLRSGLTPDVTRTGLTPLIGGPSSFPPPSPNTAAFLAMVNQQNGGANGSHQPGTITPGTFATITGAMNGMTNHSLAGASPASSNGQPHRLSISRVPQEHSYDDGNGDPTHAAANGLFLLSQAHHELTQREKHQSDKYGDNNDDIQNDRTITRKTNARTQSSAAKSTNNDAGAGNNNSKRKSNETSAAANKRAKATKPPVSRAKSSARKKSEDRSSMGDGDVNDSDDDMGSDDDELDMSGKKSGGAKKNETEEDKRKNFLERNRQAALKCRQRKKAWLGQLQAKVEFLTAENERLQNTTVSMREEISRLSAVVVAHRDCGLGGVSVARSEQLIANAAGLKPTNLSANGGAGNGHGDDMQVDAKSGVPSNAPSHDHDQSARRHGMHDLNESPLGNRATRSTSTNNANPRLTRATSSNNNVTGSPISTPPMVTVGGGGKGGRYNY